MSIIPTWTCARCKCENDGTSIVCRQCGLGRNEVYYPQGTITCPLCGRSVPRPTYELHGPLRCPSCRTSLL